MTEKRKYLWFTDTHLLPWYRRKILNKILEEKPHGVFLTGDISYGPTLLEDLKYLGKRIGRPLYFVGGNHDFSFTSFKERSQQISNICSQYKYLNWMTECDVEPLNDEVALIGTEGFYCGTNGDPSYLKYTIDWPLIKELRNLVSMNERFEMFKSLANQSVEILVPRLEKALQDFKTVYLLTHFPCWPEANRAEGTLLEEFWRPYNVNLILGKALEKVMQNYKKRNLVVLSGHTHQPMHIHVSRNIECHVGSFGLHYEKIFI